MKSKFKCCTREKEALRNHIQPPACFQTFQQVFNGRILGWCHFIVSDKGSLWKDKHGLCEEGLPEGTFGKNLNKSTTLWALPLGAAPPFHLLELTSRLIPITSMSCSKPESGKHSPGGGGGGGGAVGLITQMQWPVTSCFLWLCSQSLSRQFLG